MLESTMQTLLRGRVILASGSARRHDIIKSLGINAEIIPSTYDENLDRSKYKNHSDFVKDLAYYKVQEVYNRLKDDENPPSLIIGADTIVTMGDIIFGKPKDDDDAFRMLSCLANNHHIVYTGVCLRTPKTEIKFHQSTKVQFGNISQEQIRCYVNTKEPLDKAGGYGIQGLGGCLIERIEGDHYTVMGIPLYSLTSHLNKLCAVEQSEEQ